MMNKRYTICSLTPNDYYKGYLDLLSQLSVVGDITYEQFETHLDRLNSDVYVVVDNINNKIVASGTIFIEKKFIHELGSVGHIEDIIVDKDYRNLGIGLHLLKFLVDRARLVKCYKVILDCHENNIKFYEKCGFTKKEYQMVAYLE